MRLRALLVLLALLPACAPRPVLLARGLLGRSDLRIGARDLRDDCSGLVIGCFAASGTTIVDPAVPAPSGTAALHDSLASRGRTFRDGPPRAGDLVFFDDTWDADGDGARGDRLTHVGIVEGVSKEGVVRFLHYASGEVRRGRLDPGRPALHADPATGEEVNSWLRRRSHPEETGLLAGELFAGYGRP
ncbi:CHAP domain-containing protein [Myxococcota bacterium]|nr:CHAP domain-containing protein [Myxococcota bacterium]